MGLLSTLSEPTTGPNAIGLTLLSVIIPAHNEEGCIRSTVEHLHLELRLRNVPHEIVVVDDGSTDSTWQKLLDLCGHIPALRPVKNHGLHGFGRAVARGFACMTGDAAVVMMADESDDCRDVVRYWELLNEGWDAVFGSRFLKGGGVIDYPWLKRLVWMVAYTRSTSKIPRYAALAILLLSPIGVLRDWRYKPFVDFNFAKYVAIFEQAAPGTKVVIPTNPIWTNWTMELVKR